MTNHLSEEELILHYYGETARPDQPRVEEHLASCDDCQSAHAQLGRVLHLVETTPMPDAPAGFERTVWARLEPQLDANKGGWRAWIATPQWALAGGVD